MIFAQCGFVEVGDSDSAMLSGSAGIPTGPDSRSKVGDQKTFDHAHVSRALALPLATNNTIAKNTGTGGLERIGWMFFFGIGFIIELQMRPKFLS
jgi:hypothetical protein